mgnify:CR=1 FL=1
MLNNVKLFLFAFLCCVLYYTGFMNYYYSMHDIFFEDFLIETCKFSLNIIGSEQVAYNDLEFVIFFENKNTQISLLEHFNEWILLNNPRRCFLYLNGEWLNGEMINGYIVENGVKINFRLLITYQDNDKYNMHTRDNIFPLLLNLEKVEFVLKYPSFKKWYCELSTSSPNLEKLIDIYNNLWKVRKTVFIMSEDKKYGQILFLKEDYWKKYYDYTKIFK